MSEDAKVAAVAIPVVQAHAQGVVADPARVVVVVAADVIRDAIRLARQFVPEVVIVTAQDHVHPVRKDAIATARLNALTTVPMGAGVNAQDARTHVAVVVGQDALDAQVPARINAADAVRAAEQVVSLAAVIIARQPAIRIVQLIAWE